MFRVLRCVLPFGSSSKRESARRAEPLAGDSINLLLTTSRKMYKNDHLYLRLWVVPQCRLGAIESGNRVELTSYKINTVENWRRGYSANTTQKGTVSRQMWLKALFYDNKWSNCPLSLADASHEFQIHVSVRMLTKKFSQWTPIFFNECQWISAVIVKNRTDA